MADYSLQDFWWNKPPRTESQLSALQLGVQMVQNKARLDLQERDLANDIARTSLMREEMLHKQKLQISLVAGNAAIAGAIASVDDWTDPEQVQRVYEVGAQYPMVVGSKAWQGAEYMQRNAITARRLEANTQSLIESRADRSELNALIEERRALLADSTIDLNDARILKYNEDIGMMEREMSVREGNLALRGVELEQKGKRLSLRDAAAYKNELAALDREEKAKLEGKSGDEADRLRKLTNLKRRGLVEKFYGPQTAEPKTPRAGLQTREPVTDQMPAFPAMPSRKEDLKKDETYLTPLGPATWDGEKFIPE